MTAYVYTSGGFPSAPTSGDSLFKNGAFYDWTGAAWKIRSATPLRSEFIATANQATKTGLTYFVGSIDCYINGAKMLLGTDFTATDGTSVTFTPALDLDDEVQLIMGVSASVVAGTNGTDGVIGVTDYILAENMTAGSVALINSLGKVEIATGTTAIAKSYYENTLYVMSGNNTSYKGHIEADPLNSNRFAVVQVADNGAWVTVATVSGTAITWGTPLLLLTGNQMQQAPRVAWDPHTASGRLAVKFGGSSQNTYVNIVTVSGTTCTSQSQTIQFTTSMHSTDFTWVPGIAGRIAHSNKSNKSIMMSNVSASHALTSNTSATLGGLDYMGASIQFFPDDGTKAVLMYDTSSGIVVRIATFSSSAITLGAEQLTVSGSWVNGYRHSSIAFPYNDSSKVVIISEGLDNTGNLKAIAATISGDTFTFGDAVLINAGGVNETTDALLLVNPLDSTSVIVSTQTGGSSSNLQELKLTGTTIAIEGSATGYVDTSGHAFIANLSNTGKFVMFRNGSGSATISSYGVPSTSTLTAGKIAGLLTSAGTTGQTKQVQFTGKLDVFTGLTIGAEYYAQPTGGISTSNTSGAVLIGFAASATTIQIK